jgi:aromatic-ring opening dioxygenase LigAB LigA subunit
LVSNPKGNIDNAGKDEQPMTRDYWLNKLFYDIQQPAVAAEYKKDRNAVLARYPMSAELRAALIGDDIATIAPHVNAYLLRFYYAICGMKDAEFIRRLNEIPKTEAASKGVSHG